MRFCDFFISYKIGLKGVKNIIPFIKLPLYRKLAVITTYVILMLSGIMILIQQYKGAFGILIFGVVLLLIFFVVDSTKNNLENMLNQYHIPYSQKRINMVIDLLKKYNININDVHKIDLLICEAQNAREQSDYFALLKKPLKSLSAIIIPIIVYVAKRLGDDSTQQELLTVTIIIIIIAILLFSVIISIVPVLKELICRDYNKYNDLISDLTQIKIFSSETKNDYIQQ